MAIKIESHLIGDVKVLDVIGNLILGEGISTIQQAIKECREKFILLNLEKVKCVDSAGVNELLACFEEANGLYRQLKITRLNTQKLGFVQITRLSKAFEFFDNEPAAIRSFPT